MIRPLALVALSSALLSQPSAQQLDPAQPPLRSPSAIRISVDLVQIDAVVTDSRGRHVTDLTAADFEVLEDGKPQTLSAFTYVPAGTLAPSSVGSGSTLPPAPPPAVGPARPITRDQVRRTMAIVVDDLSLSFESIARVRNVLRRFLDEHMQPGDLVAILRTGAGMGALQQFTTDRRQLLAAVDNVRWNMEARVAPFEAATGIDTRLEALERELATAATLGAVQYVVRGVAQLPGRKSILLLSDGFRLTDADMRYGRVLDMLRTIVDSTNRAGVVLYGIDVRGLVATAPTAADGNAVNPVELLASRDRELSGTQEGLSALVGETGGLFITNTNDLGGALRRVLDDQQGYYLLGYVPQTSTFSTRNPKFHSLAVRVKRDGLRARSRRGFLGRPDNPTVDTPANRMVAAVTSPFAGGDIRLRLSSFFGHAEKTGPVILSVMHVAARDLAFSKQAHVGDPALPRELRQPKEVHRDCQAREPDEANRGREIREIEIRRQGGVVTYRRARGQRHGRRCVVPSSGRDSNHDAGRTVRRRGAPFASAASGGPPRGDRHQCWRPRHPGSRCVRGTWAGAGGPERGVTPGLAIVLATISQRRQSG